MQFDSHINTTHEKPVEMIKILTKNINKRLNIRHTNMFKQDAQEYYFLSVQNVKKQRLSTDDL